VPQAVWDAAESVAPGVEFSLRERTEVRDGVLHVLQGKLPDGKRIEFRSDATGGQHSLRLERTKEELPPPVQELLNTAFSDVRIERMDAMQLRLDGAVFSYLIVGTRKGSPFEVFVYPDGKDVKTRDGKRYYVWEIPLEEVPREAREAADAAQPGVSWHTAELIPEKGRGDVFHQYGIDAEGHEIHTMHDKDLTIGGKKVQLDEVPELAKAAIHKAYPNFKINTVWAMGGKTPDIVYYQFYGTVNEVSLSLISDPGGRSVSVGQ
jgi:hypothetical protein